MSYLRQIMGSTSIHFSRRNRFGAVQRELRGTPEFVEAGESVASAYCQASADDAVGWQGADAPKRVRRGRKFARDVAEVLFWREPFAGLWADAANVKGGPVAIFSESSPRGD